MGRRLAEIGPDDGRVLAIAELIRADLAVEAQRGFPTLTRIPSSGTVKFLDYFATLTADDGTALIDGLARLAALRFFPPPLIATAHAQVRRTNSSYAFCYQALQSPRFALGFRYAGLRMSRALLNDSESMAHLTRTRATLDFQPRDDPPAQLVKTGDLRSVETAKAPLLRKLLNQMLTQRYRPKRRSGPAANSSTKARSTAYR
ncbi:MAG TPA: hypothetical protein VFC56_10680 [Stellaceae bacterium]|nr:hypothetical protein [Stellaceae bacterium]